VNTCSEKLEISDIENLFLRGCKQEEKIGLEYERLPVSISDNSAVPYEGEYGICEFLREYARENNWDYILDDNSIIGLKKCHDTITLEPGCQIELSLEPEYSVQLLKDKIEKIDFEMENLLDLFEIKLLAKGIYPKSTYKNIKLIPKRRYHLMADYLWGILSDVMMRETAGIQVGIDFKSEEDAMYKFYLANLMSPFITSVYCNSRFRGGVDTSYFSFRALAWLNTDNDRCGFATELSKELTFKDYIYAVLKSPVIFIVRDNKLLNFNGKISFLNFMKNGYLGCEANIDDFKLHSNLFFPEVRLRKFVEIRNHDSVGKGLQYSVPAFYKGIMYNNDASFEVEKLLSKFKSRDISDFRYNVPKFALNYKIGKYKVKDIVSELYKISYESLKYKNDADYKFLEPAIDMISNGLTPLDI